MQCIHSFRIFCYFLLFVHFIVLSNAASINRSIGNEIQSINQSYLIDNNQIVEFERGIGFQTTDKLILQAGYHAETHQVTTKDGFVITFFRILKNEDEFNDINSGENAKNRKTIVLQHGMLCSSSDWVFAGPKRSLGFVLADLGHDVWLTNVRGNIYGRNTTDENVSWDFSFHEMGKYDLPAQIDYILDKTRAEKLYYIGYSMGTTAFYTMMSIKPKYNSKFKGMISLAPISFLNNVKGLMIHVIKYFSSFIASFLKLFNIRIVFKHPITFNNNNICDYPIIGKICVAFISSICGFDSGQYDKEMVSRYLAVTPVGTSWKVAQHYFQLMESGAFRQFDYGSSKNLRLYGQEVPPDYDLEKFKVTVTLIQGDNDYLSVFEDARKLLDQLGSYIRIHIKLGNSQFSHADFMWAKDVDTILFPTILHSLDIMGNSTVPSYKLPENFNDYSIKVHNVSSRTHLD